MPARPRIERLTAALVFLIVLSLLALSAFPQAAPPDDNRPTVVLIPVNGLIDDGLYKSIVRRLDESKAYNPVLLVFRIDTYGGLVDSAIEITDEIGGIDNPKTVAYVPTKAYSAGAMIAMGAREIVLTPSSSIGDVAPVSQTSEGPKMLGEKFQSPVRSMLRKYAQRNGYPEALVEAMVTADLEVVQVAYKDGSIDYMLKEEHEQLPEARKTDVENVKTVVRKGEILTLTASEALEYGIARFVVNDFEELLEKYDLADARTVTLDVNWSEKMVRWLNHPAIAGIILLIGIMGIYMEFKVPGFGLPGIVGVICLATFFFSKHLVGLATNWEIIIFVIGVVLLGIELFVIPGFGVTGFLGITLIAISLVLAFIPSHITLAPLDLRFLVTAGVTLVAVLIAAFLLGIFLAWLLPKTPVVGKFYLGEPAPESVAHSEAAGQTAGRRDLLGMVGRAQTPLRPAGRAIIGGEFYDVTTEGSMVARGAEIEVIAVRGNKIVVREIA